MNVEFKRISVIGLGYIGLPTAAMLASRGQQVIGVDVDPIVVDTINNGKIHIVEPDLDILVHSVVNTGHLRAINIPTAADAFLITVPTPFKNQHEPDLSFVDAAFASIAPILEKGNLIILESTSPVGTTEQASQQLATLRPDLTFPHQHAEKADIHIAYCPERVMPGQIIRELIENDRMIGGITKTCAEKAKALYRLFVKGECIITDSRTAEMAKLTENAFRDMNIAFANELSMICDKLQINVWELIKLANRHPRVNILQPGPGVGGHCIAVDPWFIVHAAPEMANLIRTAREVNDSKPLHVLDIIQKAVANNTHAAIACLGLTYKANSDDLRESPAAKIVHMLTFSTNADFYIVEPHIKQLPHDLQQNKRCQLVNIDEALTAANVVVKLVAHDAFKAIDANKLKGKKLINVANADEPPRCMGGEMPPKASKGRAVTEYGLMMMNRIYGNIIL